MSGTFDTARPNPGGTAQAGAGGSNAEESVVILRELVIQGSCRSSRAHAGIATAGPAAGDTQRTAHEAVDRVAKAIVQHKMRIIDITRWPR